MSAAFDRDALLDAFDRIGRAAAGAGTKLQIAVYGGSALMLASNFRFATEDVDIREIGHRLARLVVQGRVAQSQPRIDWHDDWFNDGVTFHLSPLGDSARDHLDFGTFPRGMARRWVLSVFSPSARYMLALKLKALRIMDFDKGAQRACRISSNLLKVVGI